MKEFTQLFRYVLAPESDWGKFSRKIISILVSATVGAFGFGMYLQYQNPRLGEQPVSVVLSEDKEKSEVIRRSLEALMRADSDIESVWLYSWPDARQIVPVMYVGDSINPLPTGVFSPHDAPLLGIFLFGDCGGLDRNFTNISCPINGNEDSWGVLVINYGEGYEDEIPSYVSSLAEGTGHRIGLLLYSNAQHISEVK